MKIIKRYFDCLLGPVWEKTYDICKEELPHYIELNKVPQPTSYVAFSDKEELLELNPEDSEYIKKVFAESREPIEYNKDTYKELYKDIDEN